MTRFIVVDYDYTDGHLNLIANCKTLDEAKDALLTHRNEMISEYTGYMPTRDDKPTLSNVTNIGHDIDISIADNGKSVSLVIDGDFMCEYAIMEINVD